MDFYELLSTFDQVGGFDVVLPFILVFTLVFAVLQKIHLFGEGKKNINAIVALVISIFFLNNTYLIVVLQRFLPNVSIFLVIFLMFLLLLGIFTGGRGFSNIAMGVAVIVSILAVLFALFSDIFTPALGGGTGLGVWYASIDPGTRFMTWLLVLAVIFVMFVLKDDNPRNQGNGVRGFLEGILDNSGGRRNP